MGTAAAALGRRRMRVHRSVCGGIAALALAFGLATAGLAATAPVNETPARFVTRLFAIYQPDGGWWKDWPDTAAGRKADAVYQKMIYADFYDPAFVKLMMDNGALAGAKGAGVDLDYDPICQCQDSGTRYSYVSGAWKGALFDAVVKGENGEADWTLVLTKTPAGWRVYDVLDESGDVRARLSKDNACLRAAKTEKAGEACIG
jgi:hypothetical protein